MTGLTPGHEWPLVTRPPPSGRPPWSPLPAHPAIINALT